MQNTVDRLEDKIRNAALDNAQREELLKLTGSLRDEFGQLTDGDKETAESIAGFAHAAAHEALRQRGNPKLQKLASDGLLSSVEDFEDTHPRLVEIVNGFCTMLSNIGI